MLVFLTEYLISPALVIFLAAIGGILYFRLRFFPISKAGCVIKNLRNEDCAKGASPYKALAVALAGTLGVGNIAGVALAISAAGAGALFWMWVSAFFAMIIKYAETVVAVKHRQIYGGKLCGGAMYFIKNGTATFFFALFCVLSSFTVGSAIQTNTIAESLLLSFDIPRAATGVLFAVCTLLIIRRGFSGVESFCSVVIPVLTGAYTIMTLCIIILNSEILPQIFLSIFKEAFGIRQAGAGAGGFLLASAIKSGFSKGLITNEAGCGTSPIAHSESLGTDPVKQGFLGIAEVFIDTIVLCSLTGIAVLIAMNKSPSLYGMELVTSIFSSYFGVFADVLLCLSMFLFALASVVGWSHYGSAALHYLFGGSPPLKLYRLILAACAFAGCLGEADTVWRLADLTCAAMTFINTTGVMFYLRELENETAAFFEKEKAKAENRAAQRRKI